MQQGHPQNNNPNKDASVGASCSHRNPWVAGGLQETFKTPSFVHSHTNTNTCTDTHIHTRYTALLINPEITKPITTTLHLIRNYLKHFPIRLYTLIKKDHHVSGTAHRGTSEQVCVAVNVSVHFHWPFPKHFNPSSSPNPPKKGEITTDVITCDIVKEITSFRHYYTIFWRMFHLFLSVWKLMGSKHF